MKRGADPPGTAPLTVRRGSEPVQDVVALEAPLELRLGGRPLAVTLRTPGHDLDLGLGFLLAEGVIELKADVIGWEASTEQGGSILDFILGDEALDRWARRRVKREFTSNSACGACGKPRLEDLFIEPLRAATSEHSNLAGMDESQGGEGGLLAVHEDLDFQPWIERVRARQPIFAATGGCHAAASFQLHGECLSVFEDVGRHNALDKLVGDALQRGSGERILDGYVVLSTGRAGFEIVQKSLRARASGLVTLGAATSMAVALAKDGGLPLVAFAGGKDPVLCNA